MATVLDGLGQVAGDVTKQTKTRDGRAGVRAPSRGRHRGTLPLGHRVRAHAAVTGAARGRQGFIHYYSIQATTSSRRLSQALVIEPRGFKRLDFRWLVG
jgi:hypothetical protein